MMLKNSVIACLLFLLSLETSAQTEHEFQVRAGLGWSIYSTESSFSYSVNNSSILEKHSDGAITLHLPIELRYQFTRRWNAGIDLKFGSYLYNPDSADGKSNHFTVAGIAAEYNLIARERLRWYIGAGFNFSSLQLQEDKTEGNTQVQNIITYSGGGSRLNSGVILFLTHWLGVNFNMGYDTHHFNLRKFEQNGSSLNLDNIDGLLKVKGLDGTIGLVIKL